MEIDTVIPNRLLSSVVKSGFDGESESGAWLLFSKSIVNKDIWTSETLHRYILRQIWPFGKNDVESVSPEHLTINTDSFVPIMKKASEGFECGFLHGHPDGYCHFSKTDDENERALLNAVKNRNGEESKLVSLLVLPNGILRARCWFGFNEYKNCNVTVTGCKFNRFGKSDDKTDIHAHFDRQIRLFGESFCRILQDLKILVVGAGGTGSALAVMLARAGIKKIAIVDPDFIESTNIHRLHGANVGDIGKSKAISLAEYINNIGLGNSAVGFQGNILQNEFQDMLKTADIIFSATDDHAGRILLNRFAYFYETPVIDLGLATAKFDSGQIQDLSGRVTTLYPGTTCLLCRGIVDTQQAREENIERFDLESYEKQREDGYIIGGGEPEPAFVSMTTSVATMAMEELIQMINGFRVGKNEITQRFRRFHIPEDRIVADSPKSECQNCGTSKNWGIGDLTPFLDRVA